MSIISRNQITIINVNDGEPGPAGPQGDPGQDGSDGQSLYMWTAFADDAFGNGISLSPSGKPYIGFANNKSSSSPDLNNPSEYTWTPFYSNLIAEVIQIISGGAIKSHNYAPGSAGFRIDSDGSAEFEDGVFRGLVDNSLFTTREGSNAQSPVSFSPKTHWYVNELYDAIRASAGSNLVNASLTYKGVAYSKIASLEVGEQIELVPLFAVESHSSHDQTTTQTVTGTVPITGTYRFRYYYELRPKVVKNNGEIEYAEGALIVRENGIVILDRTIHVSSDVFRELDTEYLEVGMVAGRAYEIELTAVTGDDGDAWINATMYFKATVSGVYGTNNSGSFVLPKTDYLSQSTESFSISSPISWVSSSHDDYALGDGFVNGLPSSLVIGGIYNASGSVSVDGSGYTITSIMKASSEKINVYTTTANFEFEIGGFYNASGSYSIQLQAEAILTKTMIPKANDSYDLGVSASERFRTLFIKTVYGDAVYGAVGNDLADNIEAPPGWCFGYAHIHCGRYYGIPSDTASITAGEVTERAMPRAVAGFVLVHVDKAYPVNTPLTYKDDGTLTKKRWWMRRPVIATYYMKPEHDVWNDAVVNGRHIVKVVC
ncbi:MAG: collagen-like protein [Candidatus Bathyarchaeota archaeon]|nr:collagen-like protein [Candidatus Bathyarchaeota archaeon]